MKPFLCARCERQNRHLLPRCRTRTALFGLATVVALLAVFSGAGPLLSGLDSAGFPRSLAVVLLLAVVIALFAVAVVLLLAAVRFAWRRVSNE